MTPNQTISDLAPWVRVLAKERTRNRADLFDDAVQEGLIGAYSALTKMPDAPWAYLVGAAKNGINSVVAGRNYTGQAGRRGWRDAHDSATWLPEDVEDSEDFPARTAAAELEAVESVDIREAIHAAVGTLRRRDREQVFCRFWLDLPAAEIAVRIGTKRGTVESAWVCRIRPALAQQLQGVAA